MKRNGHRDRGIVIGNRERQQKKMNRLKQSIQNIVRILAVLFHITPRLFFLIILTTMLNASLPFVNIVFSQLIIDEFMGAADYGILTVYAITAISLNVVIFFFIGILSKKRTETNAELDLRFNKKLNFHQMNLKFQDIESYKVNELQRNIEQAKMRNGGLEAILSILETIMRNVFNMVLASVSFIRIFSFHKTANQTSFWIGPWPLFILLLLTVMSVVCSFRLQAKQNAKISDLNQQANQANGSAILYMQLISDYNFGKDIRIYRLKAFLCNDFNKLWSSSIGYKLTKQLGREKSKIPCIVSLCNSILDLFIYLLAVMKAIAGEITAGGVVLYIGSIQIFTQSIMELINSIGEMTGYGELLIPYLTLLGMLDEKPTETGRTLPIAPYTISFENVSFRYPDADLWVLEDVNFTIMHGQRTALVGVNGSGKSTAIKLLCRMYEPQKGQITLNGINIKEFDIFRYRMLISVVFQDFSLLSLKLGETVACSDQYEKEQVLTAIKSAGLSEWMTNQSESVDTYLYKDYAGSGVEISGGEAQKIAIARAFYKNAPLVILDEPTAALDPRAEAEIYEDSDRIISGKTAVYISHRLSSCRFCHNILVFDGGHLIQTGTHEQLVRQSGQYQNLWEAQAQFYKNVNE